MQNSEYVSKKLVWNYKYEYKTGVEFQVCEYEVEAEFWMWIWIIASVLVGSKSEFKSKTVVIVWNLFQTRRKKD